MLTRLLVALSLLVALPAYASCTWTQSTNAIAAKVVCTTANESAPSAATDGLPLSAVVAGNKKLSGFSVTAEADSGQTLSGSGTLQAYLYDDQAAAWVRVPDLDLAVTASGIRRQGFPGFEVLAGRVGSRVAFVAVSVGVSAGGITLYLNGDI